MSEKGCLSDDELAGSMVIKFKKPKCMIDTNQNCDEWCFQILYTKLINKSAAQLIGT